MTRRKWVTIGVVVAPHGVHGEVRVKPLTDFPERFLSTKRVFVAKANGEYQELAVGRARPHGRGLFVLRLNGITNRDDAEGLRNLELQVPREEAVPLPEDSYYVFDLVDAEVFTVDGESLGRLVDVIHTGANDVFHVRNSEGKEVLIPVLKDVVKLIDLNGRRIEVDPPEGLL